MYGRGENGFSHEVADDEVSVGSTQITTVRGGAAEGWTGPAEIAFASKGSSKNGGAAIKRILGRSLLGKMLSKPGLRSY
jgi:hypothetical protein